MQHRVGAAGLGGDGVTGDDGAVGDPAVVGDGGSVAGNGAAHAASESHGDQRRRHDRRGPPHWPCSARDQPSTQRGDGGDHEEEPERIVLVGHPQVAGRHRAEHDGQLRRCAEDALGRGGPAGRRRGREHRVERRTGERERGPLDEAEQGGDDRLPGQRVGDTARGDDQAAGDREAEATMPVDGPTGIGRQDEHGQAEQRERQADELIEAPRESMKRLQMTS